MRLGCFLIALAACGDGDTGATGGTAGGPPVSSRPANVIVCASPAAQDHPAAVAFQSALATGDRASRASVIDGLKQAASENPDEEAFQLSLGLAYLWRLAEPLEHEVADISGLATAGLGARSALEKAYAICPTDHRIPAWLGPVLINMGRATQNADMVAEGNTVLALGMAEYPTFVAFSQLLVNADAASTSAEFRAGVEVMEQAAIACVKEPDAAACSNTGGSFHNVQGTMLFLVDAHSKLANRDKANEYLNLARAESGWASWDFQEEVALRSANLDARIASLTDADTTNDPQLIWKSTQQCAVCHQE